MRGTLGVELFRSKHPRPPEHRGERRAQLVRDHRDELILRTARGLGFGARCLFGRLPRSALQSERDVMSNRLAELEFVGGEVVGLIVVQHELAEQFALGDEWDERERAEALCPKERKEGSEGIVGKCVRNDDGLGVLGVSPPRRMALHGRAVCVGQPGPDTEPHHSLIVERQYASPVGHDARHERSESLLINCFHGRRTADAVNELVEDLDDVARLLDVAAMKITHEQEILLQKASPILCSSHPDLPQCSSHPDQNKRRIAILYRSMFYKSAS